MDHEQHHMDGTTWPEALHAKARHHARAAYACYFLLGAGVLAPWNALLMASDYWGLLYPGRHVDRTFTVCYLPTCLLLVGAFIRWPRLLSHRARILGGFGGFFLCMLAVPALDAAFVAAGAPEGPPAAYALLLGVVLCVGLLDGLCQGAVFGDAATLPSQYTHAVVGGTASSGALISLLRLATKASLPPTRAGLRRSAAVYFGCSAALSLACFCVYAWVLPRLGLVALWRRRRAAAAAAAEAAAGAAAGAQEGASAAAAGGGRRRSREGSRSGSGRISGSGGTGGADEEPLIRQANSHAGPGDGATPGHGSCSTGVASSRRQQQQQPQQQQQQQQPQHHHQQQQGPQTPRGHAAVVVVETGRDFDARPGWRACLVSVWPLAAGLVVVYVVTLSIFPGVLAEDSRSSDLGDWYPLLLMTLFNACDLAGKNVPLPPAPGAESAASQRRLLAWAAARAAFLPAFVAALRLGAPAGVVAGLTAALGASNGYLTALAMTRAHATASTSVAADMVENCMVFCLVLGLLLGALLGWCWLL